MFFFILHAFHTLDLGFWVFENFLGFFKIDEVFVNFWVGLCLIDCKCSCIASHLHYNYIVMHFFMCPIYVVLLYAGRIGLDWVQDVYMLHITCSCIFMHMYLHSFILILILLVLFYMLLSPFLFLSISCFMAPKWKSAFSRNPLHSEASSSSNPTPSHVWFCDDKAQKDFSENFSRRGINSKRQVILSDFSDTDLPTIIYSRGWELLCGILVTCPFVIINEFYSNMHGFDTSIPQFVTCVQGMHIVVTPDLISEVLHVPKVVHPDYPGCNRLRAMSKDELMSLFCETPSS